MNYIFDTVFKLTSPLHISAPGEWYIGPSDRFPTTQQGNGRFPVTRTQHMPLAIPGNDGPRRIMIPQIPANTIRGDIRRKMGNQILDRLAKKGTPADLGLFHVLTCGARAAVPGNREEVAPFVEAAVDPYFGTCGGGPRWFPSRLVIGTAMVISQETLEADIVPDRYASLTSNLQTGTTFFRRVDDAFSMSDPNILSRVENFQESMTEWQAAIGSAKKAKAAGEEGAKKESLTGFNAMEFVSPGTHLYARLELEADACGPAGLGAFATSLAQMATTQRIGGWSRNGFGRFVTSIQFGRSRSEMRPLLIKNGDEYSVSTSGDSELADAVAAWQDYLANIDRDTLVTLAS